MNPAHNTSSLDWDARSLSSMSEQARLIDFLHYLPLTYLKSVSSDRREATYDWAFQQVSPKTHRTSANHAAGTPDQFAYVNAGHGFPAPSRDSRTIYQSSAATIMAPRTVGTTSPSATGTTNPTSLAFSWGPASNPDSYPRQQMTPDVYNQPFIQSGYRSRQQERNSTGRGTVSSLQSDEHMGLIPDMQSSSTVAMAGGAPGITQAGPFPLQSSGGPDSKWINSSLYSYSVARSSSSTRRSQYRTRS